MYNTGNTMIFSITAILLWIICIALICRLLQYFYRETTFGIAEKIIWPVLIIASIILLFRPHEDIYGGQDPGSYLNSAVSYARHNAVTYVDPLLAKVPTEQRHLFFYGHSGFRKTKDACLWIKDIKKATVGPWFQPAYPLLLSIIAKITPKLILYIVPLFTILTGITIAVLARFLFSGRWIGIITFLLYILNPNTAWHGRCPRPGIIASFLIIGGWTLFLKSSNKQNRNSLINILVASIAIASAPFFHVTAWFVIVPLSIWVFIMCFRKNNFFLMYPPIILISIIMTYFQSLYITDCYGIGKALKKFPIPPIILFILLASAIIGFAGFILYVKPKYKKIELHTDKIKLSENGIRILSAIVVTLGIIIFITTYMGSINTGKSLFSNTRLLKYLRISDIQRFTVLVSRPMALLGLIGWAICLLKNDNKLHYRLATALVLLPAAMLIGKIPHLMYYSRYMQPFLIPLYILCLTSLFSLIPQKKYIYNTSCLILLTGLLLLSTHNRTHLYKLTEDRGFIDSLESIANEIQSHNGILLCEYSRIAAPFDHFFGIPTLGIDDKRQGNNYKEIATVWENIIKATPDKPAYFLTPFDSDMTNHLQLTHIKTYNTKGQKLRTSASLPTKITDYSLRLRLSLVSLPETGN